ncbi:MAG: hypothetical protein GEU97_15805 [Actinophytocola sp.]|nr:hypothetical protein [Actinophytocola sp.]
MTSALSELTCLQLHRPAASAAPAAWAVWFDELVHVHEHLAAEARDPHVVATERRLARTAHRRASLLRKES